MNKIRRISFQLIERYPDLFTAEYEKNKEIINKVANFRSKELRNKVVGYITHYIKSNAKKVTTTA